MLEQFLSTLPENVRVWVKERKPKSSTEASQLADDYMQARRLEQKETSAQASQRTNITCIKCGLRVGHNARREKSSLHNGGRSRRDLKDIECFNCHQKGHYSSNCPSKAMLCQSSIVRKLQSKKVKDVTQAGRIEGKFVHNLLLNTGCSRTLVHRDHVPQDKMLPGEAVAIQFAHGDTVLYPLAQLEVEIGDQSFDVTAAVADRLPLAMLLGTDVLQMTDLLQGKFVAAPEPRIKKALVVTRAVAKQQREEEEVAELKEQESGVEPTSLEEMAEQESENSLRELEWMQDLHEVKAHLTRSQKRVNKKRYHLQEDEPEKQTAEHPLEISKEELRVLQEADTTLGAIRKAADGEPYYW